MFTLRLQLPDKFKDPLEEIRKKYSKKNEIELEVESLLETLVKRYIADEFKILLLESKDGEE